MSTAVVSSHNSYKHRRHLDQRSQAARRDAFHRWLRYEPLEDRCLLSGSGSEPSYIADPAIVNITAPDHTAGEPSDNGTYRITRSGNDSSSLTVNFAVLGDAVRSTTGTDGDYCLKKSGTTLLSSGVVTIDAGKTYVDITLQPYNDGIHKSPMTASLLLETGNGYQVGTSNEASISLTDEIVGTLPAATVAATVPSASDPSTPGLFTITRSGTDTTSSITVDFGMTGTAALGTDYTLRDASSNPLTNSVTIAAGSLSATVTLTVVPTITPSAETAILTVQAGSGYVIGSPKSATVNVTHTGSTAVSVSATDATAGAPSDPGRFEITRVSADYTQPLTVSFDMTASTATRGSDYVLSDDAGTIATATNTVVIPGGARFVDITLTAINTNLTSTETAILTVDAGTGYGVSAAPANSATVSIINENPNVVTISAPDASAAAPSDTGTYEIVRTGGLTSALVVNFTTGGNAARGTDYTLVTDWNTPQQATLAGNSVTIPANSSYVDVTLAVASGSTTTTSETASLTIQSGAGYQVGVSSGASINIAVNNVSSLSVAALNDDASEPSTNSAFRISRTGDTSRPLTVTFTMGGTAVQGTDYTLKAADGTALAGSSITMAAGQSSVDVTLAVLENGTADFPRTATMTLTDGTVLSNSATITIYDDSSHWQTILPDDLYSASNQSVSIPVQYTTSTNDNTLSGLGLRLYYDSTFMTFDSLSNVLQTGLVSEETDTIDQTDATKFPGDNTYVMVSWADLAGNWPNQGLPTTLFVANFILNPGATGTSTVHFAATPATGYSFQDATNPATMATGINVTAITPNLDVDGNGVCDPLTDGVLIMRYLFAQGGTWTTAGAIGSGATRTTYDQINSYLNAASSSMMLDVDGNGQCDALTDGMLIMRYLFDPNGAWSTTGLIGTGATRTTQADIKGFLDSLLPTSSVSGLQLQQLSGLASQQGSPATASAVLASDQTAQNQIVTPSQTGISASPGTDVSFDVNYSTNPSDPTLSGLGLRMYYNSSLLTFNGLSNVLANGMILQGTPQDDTNNSDGDSSTDKYVLVGWADMTQNWPGAQSQRLYTADFTLNAGATSATHVNFGASSTAAGWTFASTPVTVTPNAVTPNAGPTIGSVVVSTAKNVITWNAVNSDGVAGASLKIDGANVSKVYGPYAATSGVNYSGAIGTLSAGTHTYLITATDKTGHSSTYSGSFDVVAVLNNGPAIGSVVVSMAKKAITWNAADSDGVAGSSLKIDGVNVSKVYGPYAATSGVNYSGATGTLAAGSHQYVITATDKAGHSSSYSGSFDVVAAANNGPTIGSVVVSAAKKVITWNAADAAGVAGCSLTIDGANVSQIHGPYAAAVGANFYAAIAGLSASVHTYVITATDKAGNSSSITGTFNVSGSAKSAVSAASLASDAVLGALANTTVSAKTAWLYDDSNLLSA